MTSILQLSTSMRNLLFGTANAAARDAAFLARKRRFDGASFVQTLVCGWQANPTASLKLLTSFAAARHVQITPQGLDQRFTPAAADTLRRLLLVATEFTISRDTHTNGLLAQFSDVVVMDSTTISLPDQLAPVWQGCGGSTADSGAAALKVQVAFGLRSGTLYGLHLEQGRGPDVSSSLQQIALPTDSIRLADLGYFKLEVLAELNEQRVNWLSRYHVKAKLYDEWGQELELVSYLAAQAGDVVDQLVQIGKRRVAARLIAVRVSGAVAQTRRERRVQRAKRKYQPVSERALALSDWQIMLTNVAAERLSSAAAVVLYRARWQIELLFKLWKQQNLVDEWVSKKPWRILCEVYAKLLGVVLQHWTLVVCSWQQEQRSLVSAGQVVRSMMGSIANALDSRWQLCTVLTEIEQMLVGTKMESSRKQPRTYQLLNLPFHLCPLT